MSCKVKYYSGAGECKALPESIMGLLLLDKGHAAITKVNAKTTTGLKALVAPATLAALDGCILDGRRGIEPGGGENELTNSNLNFPDLTNVSAITMEVYANMSWNDYVNYFAFEGKSLEIGLFDAAGDLWGTNASVTNFTGFRGRLFLDKKLPPVGADKQKAFHFHVVFEDMTEFGDKMEKLDTSYSFIQAVEDVNPVGIDIVVKTPIAQTTGYVTIKATKRGTNEPYTGLTTTSEWGILSADTDVGVTLAVQSYANAALGEYTLTILNGTPADITGDVYIQAYKVATGVMTYLSNPLVIHKYSA